MTADIVPFNSSIESMTTYRLVRRREFHGEPGMFWIDHMSYVGNEEGLAQLRREGWEVET